MPRCSIPPIGSPDAFPGFTKSSAVRGCSRDAGASTRDEDVSPGQLDEIDRVLARYPHLTDDEFVKEHLHRWLS